MTPGPRNWQQATMKQAMTSSMSSRMAFSAARPRDSIWRKVSRRAAAFCGSRLAIGAATERARALALPAGTRAKPSKRDAGGVAPASPQVAYREPSRSTEKSWLGPRQGRS